MISENFEPEIHTFDVLESTNSQLRKMALEGAKEGTIVIAHSQSMGRGSHNKSWHSPYGGLYFSVLLLPLSPKRATDLTIVAGVALAQAVKQIMPKSADIGVKWPNDCLLNWKKVGGILCENLGARGRGLCVVGIGLNVNVPNSDLESFQDGPFPATSMMLESSGGSYEMESVREILVTKLFTLYRLYHEEGMEPVRYLWEKNCPLMNKRVELRESGWERGGESLGVHSGVVVGLGDGGSLVLEDVRGGRREFFSGVISCYWP